jgi:RNA ligase (TIGR02306 family)
MRKLATIRTIAEIRLIENADAIELAIVDGWQAVVKKGEYSVGENVVYLEIDSWVPHTLAPFLSKGRDPREYNGVPGEVLRTMRLRGALSQGLILPLGVLAGDDETVDPYGLGELSLTFPVGYDLTEVLGIQKYEREQSAQLAGITRGSFPAFIPKTDQERVQNLKRELVEWSDQVIEWEVTEKLDGSSMTVYRYGDDIGVCSRNLNLKDDANNTFWKTAINQQLIETLTNAGVNYALQGELVGPGIQGNRYGLDNHQFFLFDIYDIDRCEYLAPADRRRWADAFNVQHVPLIMTTHTPTVDDALMSAEGESFRGGKTREGIVFKSLCGKHHFKAISNKFLLKGGN